MGEDITEELLNTPKAWLINHIMSDDQSYAPLVRETFPVTNKKSDGGWFSKAYSRFFG